MARLHINCFRVDCVLPFNWTVSAAVAAGGHVACACGLPLMFQVAHPLCCNNIGCCVSWVYVAVVSADHDHTME